MWLDLSLNNPTEPSDPNCIFCSTQVEDIGHLYFGCHWTKECLQRVNRWLNWTNTGENLEVHEGLCKFWLNACIRERDSLLL